jgi:hypothetical protein
VFTVSGTYPGLFAGSESHFFWILVARALRKSDAAALRPAAPDPYFLELVAFFFATALDIPEGATAFFLVAVVFLLVDFFPKRLVPDFRLELVERFGEEERDRELEKLEERDLELLKEEPPERLANVSVLRETDKTIAKQIIRGRLIGDSFPWMLYGVVFR